MIPVGPKLATAPPWGRSTRASPSDDPKGQRNHCDSQAQAKTTVSGEPERSSTSSAFRRSSSAHAGNEPWPKKWVACAPVKRPWRSAARAMSVPSAIRAKVTGFPEGG